MKDNSAEPIFKPALILMAGRGIGFAGAFVIPLVLARVFDQSDFGTYKQFFLISMTFVSIAQFGMAESLFYFLPEDSRDSGKFVANTLLVLGGIGIICCLIFWNLDVQIAELMNNPDLADLVGMAAIYSLFTLMSVLLESTMTIRKQHLLASVTYAASDVLRALFLILPALLFEQLSWLVWGAVIFSFLRLVSTLVYVGGQFGKNLRPSVTVLKTHLDYAVPFGVAALIRTISANYHFFTISYLFDAATFAVYAVGCLQVPLVDFLMMSISNVMMVNMREKAIQGKHEAVLQIWHDAIRKLALVLFPLIVGLIIVSYEMITVFYTPAYAESVPIFIVWTIIMVFSTLLVDSVLRVYAQTRFMILESLIQLILIFISIDWFLTNLGILGAVYTMLFATAVTQIISIARIKYIVGVSWVKLLPWSDLASILLISVGSAALAVSVKSLLDLPALIVLALTLITHSLCCGILLWRWGPLLDQEKIILLEWSRISKILPGVKF